MSDMRTLIDLCENAIQIFDPIPPITNWNDRDSVVLPLMKLRRVIIDVKRMTEGYRSRYGNNASGSGGLLDAIDDFEKQFLVCHPLVDALKEDTYLPNLVNSLTHARDVIAQFVADNYDSYENSKLCGEPMSLLFENIRTVVARIDTAILRIREIASYHSR